MVISIHIKKRHIRIIHDILIGHMAIVDQVHPPRSEGTMMI